MISINHKYLSTKQANSTSILSFYESMNVMISIKAK